MESEKEVLLESLIKEETRLEKAQADLEGTVRAAQHQLKVNVRPRLAKIRADIELIRQGQMSFDDWVNGRRPAESQAH